MKLQEVSFQKSQKLLASRAGSLEETIVRTVFMLPAIEIEWNSFWILWIGRLRGARSELVRWTVSAIFEKWPFRDQTVFSFFLKREYLMFFSDILIKKY